MAPIALQKITEELANTHPNDSKTVVNVAATSCAAMTAGFAALQALPRPAQKVALPLGIAASAVIIKMSASPSHHAHSEK